MGIQFDLIIPPIIVGFIILILFRMNSFMMSTSIDNRLSSEMQNFADATVILLQNELRTLRSIESMTDSTIRFSTTELDTIEIYKEGRNLNIATKSAATSGTQIQEHASRLKSLTFTAKQPDNSEALILANAAIIHFQVITESTPEQQAGPDNGNRVRAYAEKQVYLRNVFYN